MANEVWFADFEFISTDGEKPRPICFCGTEANSNKTIKIWLDGVENPTVPINFKDTSITYVAYYAVAEMSCHLVLGWEIPENIIDLYCEWRTLTNDGMKQANGLLNACQHFGIPTVDQAFKDKMRDRVLAGAPYSEADKIEILNYCESDIIETMALPRG